MIATGLGGLLHLFVNNFYAFGSDLWIMGCYISFDFLACAYEDCQNPGN